MTWTRQRIAELEQAYIQDRAKGLLTQTQLLNLLHRLDRIAQTIHA
jgi:hypothetical protein